jgi:hypothetical protein
MPIGVWEYGNTVGFGNGGAWLALSKDMIHWTDSLGHHSGLSDRVSGKILALGGIYCMDG